MSPQVRSPIRLQHAPVINPWIQPAGPDQRRFFAGAGRFSGAVCKEHVR